MRRSSPLRIVPKAFPFAIVLTLGASIGCSSGHSDAAGESDSDAGPTVGPDGGATGDAPCGTCDAADAHGDAGAYSDASAGSCGNGVIDPGEACDGSHLGAATCTTVGFSGGTLACSATCQLDESGCYNTCPLSSLDVAAFPVSGAVTLNGAAWPQGGVSGQDYVDAVAFYRQDNQSEFDIPIGVGGTYSALLAKGTYDVVFRGNYSLVTNIGYSQDVPITTGFVVDAAAQNDLDVEAVAVSGTVTFNGAVWPQGGVSGHDYVDAVAFYRQDNQSEFDIPIGVGGTYSALLAKGTYDVVFRGNDSLVTNIDYSQDVPITTGFAVDAAAQNDFDVAAVAVSGTVTFNGAAWPQGGVSGQDYVDAVAFYRQDNQSEFDIPIGVGGTYSALLAKGTYDVVFRGNYSLVTDVGYSQDVPITSGFAVNAAAQNDFDVAAVAVSGTVTFNGGAWPPGGVSGQDHADAVAFYRQDDQSELDIPIGVGGTYSALLAKGTYDVVFRGNDSLVTNIDYSQDVPITTGFAVNAAAEDDFDVEAVAVSGTVTFNGAAWPQGGVSGQDYADAVAFYRQDNQSELDIPIGVGGAYSALLAKGTYDVVFRGNDSLVTNIDYSQEVPMTTGFVVNAAAQNDFDVAAAAISGTVTLNGGPWPAGGISGQDNGDAVLFTRTDNLSSFGVALGPGGVFSQMLVHGIYDVDFQGNDSLVSNIDYQQLLPLQEHCKQ